MHTILAWVLGGLAVLVAGHLSQVHADAFACGNETKLHAYHPSVDETKVPACPPAFNVYKIPKDKTDEQNTLVKNAPRKDHLKIVAGLVTTMTPAEQAAVDAPIQLKKDQLAVANAEIQTNEVCANNTLTDITAYWKGPGGKQAQLAATITTLDTAIAAVTAGPAKTALQAARDALFAHMTMFINDSELQWRYICSRTFVRP